MEPYHSLLVVLPFILSINFFCGIYLIEALNSGFSVELIHRDSPKSPFYNSTETPFQRLTNAIHRSFQRVNHFYPQIQGSPYPQSDITNVRGEFLMKFAIGSPPFDVMAIVDTGSDIIWFQCMPCDSCYHQNAPIFDPSKSSSYQNVHCSSKVCGLIKNSFCSTGGESDCLYNVSYLDGTHSKGNVAFETFTLGSNVTNTFISFPKVLIGCGHDNDARYISPSVAGIVGLGASVLSLTSQLNTSFDYKFSYCLVPTFESKTTSKLNFGENAVVSGPGTVSTPLKSGPVDAFYYLTLEGMSVGSKRLDFVAESTTLNDANGNIIIDTGTLLTFLPQDFYTQLEAEVVAQINLPRVSSPNRLLSVCYSSPLNAIESPNITAHFTGADIVLSRANTFASLDHNIVCLAFTPSPSGSIFGNIAQRNFLVGYDRLKMTVSFKPADCKNF